MSLWFNIGDKSDFVGIPYEIGVNSVLSYLVTGYYHIHGESFIYPELANPVTITASSGVWTNTGTIVTVIPADTLLKPFDLHWITISNISGNGNLVIEIFKGLVGSEERIGITDCFRNSIFNQEGPKRIQVPQQEANTRISCRVSDSSGGSLSCAIKFNGHNYG